jgi:hypothetical protein
MRLAPTLGTTIVGAKEFPLDSMVTDTEPPLRLLRQQLQLATAGRRQRRSKSPPRASSCQQLPAQGTRYRRQRRSKAPPASSSQQLCFADCHCCQRRPKVSPSRSSSCHQLLLCAITAASDVLPAFLAPPPISSVSADCYCCQRRSLKPSSPPSSRHSSCSRSLPPATLPKPPSRLPSTVLLALLLPRTGIHLCPRTYFIQQLPLRIF